MPTKSAGDTINASDFNLKPDLWTLADLVALAALSPAPALVTGLSFGMVPGFGLYRYDSASLAAVDSPFVVAAAPGGRWLLDAVPVTRITATSAPTLAYSAGQGGTLSLVNALVKARTAELVSFLLEHNWTPAGITTAWTELTLSVPAGFSLAHASVYSATSSTDGLARYCALTSATTLVIRNESTSLQRVSAYLTLVRA